MLLCSVNEIEPGMHVAASVRHPARPDMELVARGLELDDALIRRLQGFGVPRIWVDHDATRDLDNKLCVDASPARRAVLEKLQASFRAASAGTISSVEVAGYRQTIMDLVCELTSHRGLAPLAERLAGSPGSMFEHCASVAYLSILVALELETYIVNQRGKLDVENARDLTALGIGAMLHDIGKLAIDQPKAAGIDARLIDQLEQAGETPEDRARFRSLLDAYRQHPVLGYQMLESARAPASARQVVLGHHQRWDGGGFPDMSKVTGGRIEGTQKGEKIHIFSRIVAAADLLEHLMRDASGKQRPVIAALHAFRSPKFDGWFDPVVQDTVLRKVPPFAVGSQVRLSDGRAGVVLEPNPVQPCMPVVRLLAGDVDSAEVLTLSGQSQLMIVSCAGENVEPYLFFVPEQEPLAKRFMFA